MRTACFWSKVHQVIGSLNENKRQEIISNFLLWTFSFIFSNNPAAHACEVYISQLIRYSRACGSNQDFLDGELLLTIEILNQRYLLAKSHFAGFMVANITWLTATEYVTDDHGYVPFVVITFRSFDHSWLIIGFATRVTRRMPHVEQELPILPEYLRSPSF